MAFDSSVCRVKETFTQRWSYDGVTLPSNEAGQITLEALKEFVACVERLDEKAQKSIMIHAYGLRAVRVGGEGGPHVDWRDWD